MKRISLIAAALLVATPALAAGDRGAWVARLNAINQAVAIERLRVEGDVHPVGELLIVAYDLVYHGDTTVVVPTNPGNGRRHLGVERIWLDPVDRVPATRPPHPGGYVPCIGPAMLSPGQHVERRTARFTRGMAPGRYRLTLEYRALADDAVIASRALELVLGPATPVAGATRDALIRGLALRRMRPAVTSVAVGQPLGVDVEIVNRTAGTLQVPDDALHGGRHLASRQGWIERLGADADIPFGNQLLARRGRAYAAGGCLVDAPGAALAPGEAVPLHVTLPTHELPPGRYRYTLELRPALNDQDAVQDRAWFEFEVR